MSLRLMLCVVTSAALLAGCTQNSMGKETLSERDSQNESLSSQTNTEESERRVFEFTTLNSSNQTGQVVIEDNDKGRAVVTITTTALDPSVYVAPQLAHIHVGACADTLVSPMDFSLQSVIEGSSVTELPISTEKLFERGIPLSLDLHKSTKESNLITNCVELIE